MDRPRHARRGGERGLDRALERRTRYPPHREEHLGSNDGVARWLQLRPVGRPCKCGCGARISRDRRSDAIWASEACAKRYRRGRAPAAPRQAASPDKAQTAPPAGLKQPGKKLWKSITASLTDDVWEFDPRELHLLERACRCADDLAALEQAVDEDGPTAKGSRGQIVVHPAMAEARHLRLVQLRLLEAIGLPEGEADG